MKIQGIDNERDKNILDLFVDDIYIGKLLKSFFVKYLSLPKNVNSIEEGRTWFYETERMRAKNYLLYLLSRYGYHSSQLRIKLKNKLISKIVTDDVLATVSPYLDDDRWVELKIKRYFMKGYGAKVIQFKLQSLGVFVDLDMVQSQFTEENQKEKVLLLLEKRSCLSEGIFNKQKAIAFLMRRGFDYDLIKECIFIFISQSKETLQ